MSIISTQHSIKHRSVANDVFITPRPLAKEHIDIVSKIFVEYHTAPHSWSTMDHMTILDPCRNNENGSYYGQLCYERDYPDEKIFPYYAIRDMEVDWCEISEGRDFFKYTRSVDIVMGNLPFSLCDKWLEHSVKLNAKLISYLMPVYSLTAKRLEMMEKAGYYLVNMHQFKWYVCNGMCCFATWMAVDDKNCGEQLHTIKPFTFNRKVWYNVDEWEKKKNREMLRKHKKEAKELAAFLRKKKREMVRAQKKWKKIKDKCLKKIEIGVTLII
tara:strand:- start:1307 stop:2119 length:813 start_codon:yes stop_codon:yes gene_type:complete